MEFLLAATLIVLILAYPETILMTLYIATILAILIGLVGIGLVVFYVT